MTFPFPSEESGGSGCAWPSPAILNTNELVLVFGRCHAVVGLPEQRHELSKTKLCEYYRFQYCRVLDFGGVLPSVLRA